MLILDASGQIRRQNNPLDQYGIQVTQVTVGDPIPEDQLNRLLMDKKLLVAERIKTIQEQETARAQAKTEQLKKEIERTRAGRVELWRATIRPFVAAGVRRTSPRADAARAPRRPRR